MYAIVFHAHQKLDRVARRHLRQLRGDDFFPAIKQILRFEAGHGPDRVHLKRQTDGSQPWHFVDPHDIGDTHIDEEIQHHYDGLTQALAEKDEVRAGFEAAWLAHALVDGLTPAHHYPYEKELEKLRGGEGRDTRRGLTGRALVKGETFSQSLKRSFQLIGPRGLLTTHAMFEAGAYSLIAPLKLSKGRPSKAELDKIIEEGVLPIFRKEAQEIASLDIYNRFCIRGWTQQISRDVRTELAPRMVKMITMAWYAAAHEAAKARA